MGQAMKLNEELWVLDLNKFNRDPAGIGRNCMFIVLFAISLSCACTFYLLYSSFSGVVSSGETLPANFPRLVIVLFTRRNILRVGHQMKHFLRLGSPTYPPTFFIRLQAFLFFLTLLISILSNPHLHFLFVYDDRIFPRCLTNFLNCLWNPVRS